MLGGAILASLTVKEGTTRTSSVLNRGLKRWRIRRRLMRLKRSEGAG